MKKSWLVFILLILLVVVAVGCKKTEPAPIIPGDSDENDSIEVTNDVLCTESGGKWIEYSSGCADTCDFVRNPEATSCIQAFVFSCDCGSDECWNGESCEPNGEIEEVADISVIEENSTDDPNDVPVAVKDAFDMACLNDVQFRIQEVCFTGDDDLRIDLESEGSYKINYFNVELRDVFDDSFRSISEPLPDLDVGESEEFEISENDYGIKPYWIRLKPVIEVGGLEDVCVPATEFFRVAEEEFDNC